MALFLPGKTLVFDYGEVISQAPSAASRTDLEKLAGVDPQVFWPSYDQHRDALDSGDLSVIEYWRAIEADTGADWTPTRVFELWAVDFPAWLRPEPGTFEILTELHDSGTRLALLSNAGFDFASPFRFSPLGSLFEQVFVSAELHDLKPRASIYEHVLRELDLEPGDMVFVDNKAVNVEAAEKLGILGHVFTTPPRLREYLVSLAAE